MNDKTNALLLEAPVVTIKGNVETRQQNTKSGAVRTVYFQLAQVECEQMRVQTDHEIDSPAHALPVGGKFAWDVVADLVPGQYGSIDTARRMTLRPLEAARTPGAGTKAA